MQLEPHQILSNEPGYYHDGAFGIRIENLVCVVPAKTEHSFGGVKYLAMEHLTMVRPRPLLVSSHALGRANRARSRHARPASQCPIATNLVEPSLLEMRELEWLNSYNAEVLAKVGPLVRDAGDQLALECVSLSRSDPLTLLAYPRRRRSDRLSSSCWSAGGSRGSASRCEPCEAALSRRKCNEDLAPFLAQSFSSSSGERP